MLERGGFFVCLANFLVVFETTKNAKNREKMDLSFLRLTDYSSKLTAKLSVFSVYSVVVKTGGHLQRSAGDKER